MYIVCVEISEIKFTNRNSKTTTTFMCGMGDGCAATEHRNETELTQMNYTVHNNKHTFI